MSDLIKRGDAILAVEWSHTPDSAISAIKNLPSITTDLSGYSDRLWKRAYDRGYARCKDDAVEAIEMLLEQSEDDEHDKKWNNAIRGAVNAVKHHTKSAQPEWNNHTVACLLAEVFNDTCACNYNGIDEWLPEKCELLDSCPNPCGVACWEQFLKHKAERKDDE